MFNSRYFWCLVAAVLVQAVVQAQEDSELAEKSQHVRVARLQPVMASAIAKDLRWSRFVVFEYVDGTADGWIVLRFRFKFPRSI